MVFISLVILQFISIPVLKGSSYVPTYLQVNIYNQFELQKRIQDFVDKKIHLTYYSEKGAYNVCKKLFQKKSCELFYMPTNTKQNNPLPSGELCCCSLLAKKGLVLCFIPSIDGTKIFSQSIKKLILTGSMYPIFMEEAEASSVSTKNILFLIHEEGSIELNVDNICNFQGIEVALLKPRNLQPTLFCRKIYSSACEPSNILIGNEENLCYLNEKYISVNCLSKIEGLFCQMKFPILTEQEVHDNIISSFKGDLKPFMQKEIPSKNYTICFPFEMSLDLLFGGIQGGLLCFSYKETGGFLQIFIMSNLAKSKQLKKMKRNHVFPLWLRKRYLFDIERIDTDCPYWFNSNVIQLVQKENSKEFELKGAKMELVCSLTDGVWGVCLSREKESLLALPAEEITCTSSNLQYQNTEETCQQTLIESPQSSDLEEGIFKGTKKRSYFCYDSEERTSKGIKKKASECLGLNLTEQGPFWDSSCGLEEEKSQKRPTDVVSLSPGLLNSSQMPLGRLTASMVRRPEDAVPLESAPLQLPALPLFTSRESKETIFYSNPFDLDVETGAFQDTMESLSAISYGLFQQNFSSTTPSESTSIATSLGIASVSQETIQLNEEIFQELLAIIESNPSSTTPFESTSIATSLEIGSVEDTSEDACAIIESNPSSTTPAESTSITTSLGIASVEDTWEDGMCYHRV